MQLNKKINFFWIKSQDKLKKFKKLGKPPTNYFLYKKLKF